MQTLLKSEMCYLLCHPERSGRVCTSLWLRTEARGVLWKPKPCRSPRQIGAGSGRGAVAGAVEGRQTHLQGPAGKEMGALPASYRGRRERVG